MPEGDPMGYADPMMGPPPGPMGPEEMGPEMGMAPPEDDMLLAMLLDAVMGKWAGSEAQLAGEKDVLMQVLMELAGAGGPMGPDQFAEGAPTNMGMMPPEEVPMDPTMGVAF